MLLAEDFNAEEIKQYLSSFLFEYDFKTLLKEKKNALKTQALQEHVLFLIIRK